MHILAATGDVWKLSGPTFLGLYAALAVVAVVVTVLARRSLTRSLAPSSRLDSPDEVAYLHDGPKLAVLTALSALHAASHIESSGRRHVRAVGTVSPDAGELQRAIHRSAQGPVTQAAIASAPLVTEVLDHIERRLIETGLLLTAEQRRRIRRTGWMLWAVVALGAIRAIASYAAGKPIGFLLALLAVVAVGAAVFSLAAPRRTDRGDAELTRLRTLHAHLSPQLRPDSRVYGPAGAALGVAVFGAGALWAANPTLAQELGTPTPSTVNSGGGDDSVGGCGCGGCGD